MPKGSSTQIRIKFTDEMDECLKTLVGQYNSDWKTIARNMNKPVTARACKERWNNVLSPYLNTSPWTPDEDQKLLKLVDKYGKNWNMLASLFPGRTSYRIKNHYRTLKSSSYSFDFDESLCDDDSSPNYALSRRQMFCPSSFRPQTIQTILFQNCSNNKNCEPTNCYSIVDDHVFRCPKGNIQCRLCRKSFPTSEIQIDHIYPVSKMLDAHADDWSSIQIANWYNKLSNLQPCCQPCNAKKSDSL